MNKLYPGAAAALDGLLRDSGFQNGWTWPQADRRVWAIPAIEADCSLSMR